MKFSNHKLIGLISFVAALFTFNQTVLAADKNINWASFQVAAIGTFQDSGFSGTGLLRYNPYYQISDTTSVGVSADASYQVLDTKNKFMATSYLANVNYALNTDLKMQISAGVQTWDCTNCSTSSAYGALLSYNMSPLWAPYIKNVWAQYLNVAHDQQAHEALLGLSLEF